MALTRTPHPQLARIGDLEVLIAAGLIREATDDERAQYLLAERDPRRHWPTWSGPAGPCTFLGKEVEPERERAAFEARLAGAAGVLVRIDQVVWIETRTFLDRRESIIGVSTAMFSVDACGKVEPAIDSDLFKGTWIY